MWFEIHITVGVPNIQRFKEACASLGLKPIILILQTQSGDISDHEVMTSYKLQSNAADNSEALAKMYEQVGELMTYDPRFKFIRAKIESSIDHPLIPSICNSIEFKPGQHFETHIEVPIKSPQEAELLNSIATSLNVHLSRNRMKEYSDSHYVQMCTFRSYDLKKEEFESAVNRLHDAINGAGLKLEKQPIVEFAVFDTKADHDIAWLTS